MANNNLDLDNSVSESIADLVVFVWVWLEKLISSFWSGLQWPHAVLIGLLVLVVFFRKEIKDAINRINEVGPSGVKLFQQVAPGRVEVSLGAVESSAVTASLDVSSTTQNEAATENNKSTALGIPLPPISFPVEMKRVLDLISAEVQGMDDSYAKNYLKERLAFMRVHWDFENIYSNIFGGQIKLLKLLNERQGVGISMVEIQGYWKKHQENCKPALDNWTDEQYLFMLKSRSLVTENNGFLMITHRATEFLLWMTANGRVSEKQF